MEVGPSNVKSWYLTCISGSSGVIIYRVLVESRLTFDNHWSPMMVDGMGNLVIGTFNGIVRFSLN